MRLTMSFRAQPFNIESWRALTFARRGVLAPLALFAIASLLLFHGLGDGVLSVFDEGLHGTLARRMLAANKYLALVDVNGEYSMDTGFSKPPLLLWLTALSMHVFDASLFSLRLPTALAMLGIVMLTFVIARSVTVDRARATTLGFVWGLLLVTSTSALELARTSNIEVLFTFFGLAAVAAAMRARESTTVRVLPLVVAGVLLALAFLTKQIIVAVPLFAIACVELASLRRERARAALRFALPLLFVVVIGAAWAFTAWQAMGDELIDTLWRFTVKDRVAGFGGDRHFRWLNRIAENLDTLCAPLPWPLGVVGVFHLAAKRQRLRDDNRIDASWMLPAYLVAATLVFENVSRSTLLWYVFSMIPPITLGLAHLVVAGLDSIGAEQESRSGRVLGGVGIAVLLLTVERSLARVASRLDALVFVGIALAIVVVWHRRAETDFKRSLVSPVVATVFTLVLVSGAMFHPSHRSGPAVDESLMARVGRFGEVPVSVDERLLARGPAPDLRLATFFGARARREPPPWVQPSDVRVRVDLVSWPEELSPREGVTLSRGPGGVVLSGSLDKPPFDERDVVALLDAGGLTFEAEHGFTTMPESLSRRDSASAGQERARRPRKDEKPPSGALTSGPWFRLAAGSYEASFDITHRCGGFAWEEKIGHVEVRSDGQKLKSKAITCKPRASTRERASTLTVPFDLSAPGHIDLVVHYNRGVLAHDKTVVRVRAPSPPAATPPAP
jgi:4-amino-4-deoxy-L-arabinose transferase-like glycosyltransferase